MIKKLLSLIKSEDKKNPMTDEELARQLGVGREKANELRQAANIPNYLIRREAGLLKTITQLLNENNALSYRQLLIKLNKQGFQLSSFGLNRYKQQINAIKAKKTDSAQPNLLKSSKPVLRVNESKEEATEAFSTIVGYNGSLKQVIKLAKAAVLYPQYGLHTLISGNTGVGKSQLVEEMRRFAQQVRSKKIPLVIFNCADYGDNPQLLVTQLFGYVKGSFTGAVADKPGLIEKANSGILFLDEIHRLPPKGQEILFRIMDKGEYARLGETDYVRRVNIMIVGATTESIESSLLNTFRRRIPVVIQIPPLESRPTAERLQLIEIFFVGEASRINKVIKVPKEIIKLLLQYRCSGNIGQLKSDIQVICAKSFLNSISGEEMIMKITVDNLPGYIKNQLADILLQTTELDIICAEELEFVPNSELTAIFVIDKNISEYNIYHFIEKRMDELLSDNKPAEEAKQILETELENKIRAITLSVENRYAGISKSLLQDIVGGEIVSVIDDIKRILVLEMGIRDVDVIKILWLHLAAAIERLRAGKTIINPYCESIKSNYQKEFNIALKIIKMLKFKLKLEFPEDEAGFIALYLNHFYKGTCWQNNNNDSKVGLLVVTHGEVARALVNIAQEIVGIRHGIAITMGIDEKVETILERVMSAAKQANQGRGILLLVDMGSLVTFGELITDELGIPTRVIARVDTLLVMEAIRKSVFPSATLYTVYDSLLELNELFPRVVSESPNGKRSEPKKIIVTTCLTGKGTALKLKQVIEDKLRLMKNDIEVVPLGLVTEKMDFAEKITCLQQANQDIVLIAGMINPYYKDIPFLSFEDIINGNKLETLVDTLNFRDALQRDNNVSDIAALRLENLFDERLVKVFHLLVSKEEILNIMASTMRKEGYVTELFYNGVMERESWGSSYIGNGVAIPHTVNPISIHKPGIGIAVIKNPVEWDEDQVSIVFLLALKMEHKDICLQLFSLIKETDMVDKIGKLSDARLIMTEVLNYAGKKQAAIKNNCWRT